MSVTVGDAGIAPRSAQALEAALARVRARWLAYLPLAAVVALSLALNTWSLSQAGYGNTYYAAAVRSMTLSWKNFFFASFDPGGFITVDKPPVFLWVGALSARLFGYSTGRCCCRAPSPAPPASACSGSSSGASSASRPRRSPPWCWR